MYASFKLSLTTSHFGRPEAAKGELARPAEGRKNFLIFEKVFKNFENKIFKKTLHFLKTPFFRILAPELAQNGPPVLSSSMPERRLKIAKSDFYIPTLGPWPTLESPLFKKGALFKAPNRAHDRP